MKYLYIAILFLLAHLLVGAQHTHDVYEVYGVANEVHDHYFDYSAKTHMH